MVDENLKAQEIKRLTTPLTFNKSKAYDCEGQLVDCIESVSNINFVIEPRPGLLSDDEILQYAPNSKAASKIRLQMGIGSYSDVFLAHKSLPGILAVYYVAIAGAAIFTFHGGNRLEMFGVLILIILPLFYLYRIFNFNNYLFKKESSKPKDDDYKAEVSKEAPVNKVSSLESLKKYESKSHDLKILYDSKESVVRDLIEKRFKPPQITYDRFMSSIDSCHKLFYNQYDAVNNIVELAAEDTPRVRNEIENKLKSMQELIDHIEDLINELVINISDEKSNDDVKVLIEDMENLIDSVKEY